jgi:hypothetical protein
MNGAGRDSWHKLTGRSKQNRALCVSREENKVELYVKAQSVPRRIRTPSQLLEGADGPFAELNNSLTLAPHHSSPRTQKIAT